MSLAETSSLRQQQLAAFIEAIGDVEYDTDPAVIAQHSQDRGEPFGADDALIVVRPHSTEEVSHALHVAHQLHLPVVPQGSLTGLAGAASAISGSVLLDLRNMNKIIEIDTANGYAVVEPGVVIDDLDRAARALGYMYAPDPASAEWATVGGSIATNAGGMRCIKYGVTRDAVRSLEVVLADGRILQTRSRTIKAVGALDITGLFVGSEGTLGVITKAWVNVVPVAGPTRAVVATFDNIDAALRAASDIARLPRTPATLELLDGTVLKATRKYDPRLDLPAAAEAWLFAVTDNADGWESDLASFTSIAEEYGALSTAQALEEDSVEEAFAARRVLNQATRAYLGGSLNGDVAVPRSAMGEYCASFPAIAEQYHVEIAMGAHVGDGNLHHVVAYRPDEKDALEHAHGAMKALWRRAQELGGTVTAEHGIGMEKLGELSGELSADVLEIQRGIKNLFDPLHILNPGKKYPVD